MNIPKQYIAISNFIKKVLAKSSPRWVVLIIDIFLVLVAFLSSYFIRFNFNFNFGNYHLPAQFLLIITLSLLSFLITNSYKGVIRHAGFRDVVIIAKSAAYITGMLLVIVFVIRKTDRFTQFNMPISVIGIFLLAMIVLLISSRILYKSFHALLMQGIEQPKKVLIHGAHSGVALFEAILSDPESKYEVVALADNRPQYLGKLVHRVNVYHPDKITEKFIIDKQIEEVIISRPDAGSIELLNIANKYLDLHLKVKTIPLIHNWIEDDINVSQIKEFNIEELLERRPIKIENPAIQSDVQDKIVMVTGAAGSIGSEIAKQVLYFNPKVLVLIDQAESALYDIQQEFIRTGFTNNFIAIVADVRDRLKMEKYFDTYKPDVIYHAAAYKHVPLMESNPYEAIKVNVLGSKNIMDLAIAHKVGKFVMISTDKAVNPTNVMGATKRAAEIYATCLKKMSGDTKIIITRFGNVLGSNGSVIQLFKRQIKKGGPLTVTHKKINRYFMTIPEACNLVLEAGTMGKGGEIFVFDMGEPVLIFNLAKKMIQLSGYRYPEDIDIIITGLRPGEKLYEETLGKNEGDLPTHHKKVKIAQINEVNCEKASRIFEQLSVYKQLSDIEIVSLLKELIPEYVSNNSVYEELDA